MQPSLLSVRSDPSLQTRYIRSSREIKRLDSLALSPIFGHFGETLQVGGLAPGSMGGGVSPVPDLQLLFSNV